MSGYVIQKTESEAFVARSGSRGSYTPYLQHARSWETREQAERECCGNERVVPIDSLFPRHAD